ncbi:4-trimethylaminobutyraldehyde dehydrogenase isoform X1 [Daphnia magna]|uniref:4-trimethylaminobutyraldehyde dehydrogenase isoform X1 n=1 Tax=Daphnia magna TaxID=35525 RepID=UPI001403E5E6|nr:4-trimethylaminobutyraldehyde dehydrogenase isoform X1 [Daphnia magna]
MLLLPTSPMRQSLFRWMPFSSFSTVNVKGGPYNFVDGQKTDSMDSNGFTNVLNPATSKRLAKIAVSGVSDVDMAVKSSKKAYDSWSMLSGFERGKLVSQLGHKILKNLEALAHLEVENNGKPIWEARLDIQSCADCFLYFGGIASTISGKHIQLPNSSFGLVKRESLGVVGGIGAWNYPLQTCSWKVAPALACGNTMVYKPSELTPLTALALAELATEAGIPRGVFNIVQGSGETGKHLCCHPDVAKISFTGSVQTGKNILKLAADDLKRVTLELGGKNPLIIYDDCDLTNAVKGALLANFLSQGQVCSNGSRVFVQRSIVDRFTDEFVKATTQLAIGDPLDNKTQVGATVSKTHAEKVLAYIKQGVGEGAVQLCGGERVHMPKPFQNGYFISPCILTNCHDEMTAVREEIFGPVATILPFDTEEEVIHRANQTPYGLSAGIFTNDLRKAHRTSNRLQSGTIWVNNFNVTPVELPFGGFKQSGIGVECSTEAIQCYTQLKSTYIEMNDIDCPLYNTQ